MDSRAGCRSSTRILDAKVLDDNTKKLSPELQRVVYERAGELGTITAASLADVIRQLGPEQVAAAAREQEQQELAMRTEDAPREPNYPRRLTNAEKLLFRIDQARPEVVARLGRQRLLDAAELLEELARALA